MLEVMRATGAAFDVVAVSGQRGVLDDEVAAAGHHVHHLRLRNPIAFVRAISLLRRRRIRVVHSVLGPASGPVLFAAQLAGVRVRIANFRSDAPGGVATPRRSLLLAISRRLIAFAATNVVGVSPWVLEKNFPGGTPRRAQVVVIPPGLDVSGLMPRAAAARAQRPAAADRLVVMNVARDEPDKNRARAIRIWARLAILRPSTLVLAGPMNPLDAAAADEVALRPEVVSQGSSIEILGDVGDIPERLGGAHVLLVTSVREGVPGVVLEAAACDTAVVATDLPGVRWIAESVAGVTPVPLHVDDRQWIGAIESAAASPGGFAPSVAASPFALAQVLRSYEDLWELTR
jgi:glycosyltransferase involved in cell wall biosynthesis